MSGILIHKVNSPDDARAFHLVPWTIYRTDPVWVPPPVSEIEGIFDPQNNAFFRKGDAVRFLATRDGKYVGRIAAMVNTEKDYHSSPSLGGFGFFESVNDRDVAFNLLDRAGVWLSSRNLDGMRGPINFGENDRWWGLLIENFHESPSYGMPYNPRYYKRAFTEYGLEKHHDQLSYKLSLDTGIPERLTRIGDRALSRDTVQVKMADLSNLEREAQDIRTIYNRAWEEMDIENFFDNFTPLTEETVNQMIRELKPVLVPEGIWMAYVQDQPASFILTIPDINQALRHLNGKMHPLNMLRFMIYRRKITRLRVLAFGTIKRYRRMGLEAAVFSKGMRYLNTSNSRYREVIGAWTGEENWLMQRSIEGAGGKMYQKHRTYIKLF